MKRSVVLVLMLCGCSSSGKQGTGAGTGSSKPGAAAMTTCDELRPKLLELYRAEAEAHESKRVDEAAADNAAMVLGDCARDPANVVACVTTASTVAELERRCLRPLDDDGSEGTELRK